MPYVLPDDLFYTADHAWLRRDGDKLDEGTVGITEFAQEQLGDVVYLELLPKGTMLTAGEPFGEIESAKTVAELFAPVGGELIASNSGLVDRPELVNASPYEEGWIIRVRILDVVDVDGLLDAEAYQALMPED